MPKYHIEYRLNIGTVSKTLDFHDYYEAEQEVLEEYNSGVIKIYNGSVMIIPSSSVVYIDIENVNDKESRLKKEAELPF